MNAGDDGRGQPPCHCHRKALLAVYHQIVLPYPTQPYFWLVNYRELAPWPRSGHVMTYLAVCRAIRSTRALSVLFFLKMPQNAAHSLMHSF